jgi:uncharacterized protein
MAPLRHPHCGAQKPCMTDLRHLALPGASFAIRATPRARRNTLVQDEDGSFRAHVTAPPEDGRANAAVLALLARALDVAPSRLRLRHGATSRAKVFVLD